MNLSKMKGFCRFSDFNRIFCMRREASEYGKSTVILLVVAPQYYGVKLDWNAGIHGTNYPNNITA